MVSVLHWSTCLNLLLNGISITLIYMFKPITEWYQYYTDLHLNLLLNGISITLIYMFKPITEWYQYYTDLHV